MEEQSTSVAETLGALVMLATIAAMLLSIRTPRARIPAGLLLLGWAVAYFSVGVWRLTQDLNVYVDRWLLFVACVSGAGVLFFRWGRRTTPA